MSFTKNRRIKRAIALFMLITFINQLFAPTVAHALTAGPTAPEATNFEPVDTTDMVNPLNGSFTYNVPLLEVPGPEGGYPLSLSYHAGIQPNEEASWVGLGWSLNPGAISRNVNGYPDDWNGGGGNTYNYWAGGQTTSWSIGIGIGPSDSPASFNVGLSFSQDTYKGFGVGVEAGVGYAFGTPDVAGGIKPFSIGLDVGISPYGETYAGTGLSYREAIGNSALINSSRIGAETNFNSTSVGFSDGIGVGGESVMGASISSNDIKPSMSVGGGSVTNVNNKNAGKISSSSGGIGISIPIGGPVSISLGYSYRRYWSATTQAFSANGVINNRITNTIGDWTATDDDNYSVLDASHPGNSDPLTQTGGTFPNFDDYNVTAQGLGGTMRPYKFASVLLNQNRTNNNDHSKDVFNEMFGYSQSSAATGLWQFRFVNDLSNNFRQGHPWVSDQIFGFDANPVSGMHHATDVLNDGYGYDALSNRLEGTNHIEYFTNQDIINGKAASRGFITVPDEGGFKRSDCPANQIGGFMITNASGVTYHYALPAYNLAEMHHSESINSPHGFASNDIYKSTPYAYTWYLTAITGPDYVSRGTQGQLSSSDWGYWVKFDYGKWSKSFVWRNPSMAMAPELDNTFQSYSSGVKELYYLDAIETRTHTAIFEKEMRTDSKGMAVFNDPNQTYSPTPFLISRGLQTTWTTLPSVTAEAYPVATLRLKNILLFQNDQLPASINTIRQASSNYTYSFPYQGNSNFPSGTQTPMFGSNVIDTFDVTSNPSLLQNCLRRIVFNHDYSLCPNLPNSYDPGGTNTYTASPVSPTQFYGKLTLLSVDFQGKGGTEVTPPTQFQYDLDPTDPANQGSVFITSAPDNQQGTVAGPTLTDPSTGLPYPSNNPINQTAGSNQLGTISIAAGNFNVGDIISFQYNGQTYWCTLLSTPTNGSIYNVLFLLNSPGSASVNTRVNTLKTKNPPFHFDAYDNWLCYKSDFKTDPGNRNLARFTTYVSSLSADVWSVRKIRSAIGTNINIDYESNTYRKSVLNRTPSVIVSNTAGTGNKLSTSGQMDVLVSLPINMTLTDLFVSGGVVSGPLKFDISGTGKNNLGQTVQYTYEQTYDLDKYPLTKIANINGANNDLTLQLDPALYSAIEAGISDGQGNPITVNSVSLTTGNVYPNFTNNVNYGGGIRVKDIKVDDLTGNILQTSYSYGVMGHMDDLTMSSGITSYLPTIMDDFSSAVSTDDAYKNVLNKRANYLTAISRQAPGPGVLYESVRVTNSTITTGGTNVQHEGSSIYQYEVFKPEMIGLEEYYYEAPYSASGGTDNGDNTWWHYSTSGSNLRIVKNAARDIAIKDYTSRVGNLKRVFTYDNNGNKLTEKINHYLYDDLDNTSFDNQVGYYEPRLASFSDVTGSAYQGVNYNDQGVLMERYGTARASIDPAHITGQTSTSQFDELMVMSNQETYPSINTGTTQIDYKNGTQTTQTNLAFDFFTGAVTKTLTTDSYGNRFISVATPAYMTGYANGGVSTLTYPALGLKTHDDDNTTPAPVQHKHMLKQQSSNYTYAVDASNTPIGVVSATVQTWSNNAPVLDPDGNVESTGTQANIWRMDAGYTWMPVGTSTTNVMPYNSFVDYFATGGSSNAAWEKTSQVTKYNVYSAALEASDINNHYAATRMGYNSSKTVITGGPARYDEIAYAGAEDATIRTGSSFSTNVTPGAGTVVTDTTKAHTGTNSLQVNAGANGFTYILNAAGKKNYSVAVWVKPTNSNANQAQLYYKVGSNQAVTPTQTLAKTAAGWYLLEMTVPAAATNGTDNLTVGCKNASATDALYFDDFRFQPSASATTAYVYDNKTGELTYILSNNNLYMRYQYDAGGRLIRTYKEVIGKSTIPIAGSIVYNYANITFKNTAISQVFYSQSCGTNYPIAFVYTVNAGTYTSTVSPADAQLQAQNDIKANGQNAANASSSDCLPTVSFTLNNSTGSPYQISFTNSTGSFPFQFNNNGSKNVNVPIGTYSVNIYPTNNPENPHTIELGSLTATNTPRYIFDNVNVSSGNTVNALVY